MAMITVPVHRDRNFLHVVILINSRGTKVGDMRTLAPESYTAGLCMVTKVIPWCI